MKVEMETSVLWMERMVCFAAGVGVYRHLLGPWCDRHPVAGALLMMLLAMGMLLCSLWGLRLVALPLWSHEGAPPTPVKKDVAE